MKTAHASAILGGLALLSGCVSTPAETASNMDFVWGCWVQKQAFDTNATVFLRLLPNADRSAYEGELTVYAKDNTVQPGGRASFARDGSRASFFLGEGTRGGGAGARAPEPTDWPAKKLTQRAFFTPQPAPYDDRTEYLVAEGGPERLIITVTDRENADRLPILDLERDGCD